MRGSDWSRSGPARIAAAVVRVASAVVLVTAFAVSATGVWVFVVLLLGLSLDEDALAGGGSTLTLWDCCLVYGAASAAAIAVLVPGVVLGWRLVRPGHV